MNARGISPAAQQVLAMLLCLVRGGYPIQSWKGGSPYSPGCGKRYPVQAGSTPFIPGQGVSHPVLTGGGGGEVPHPVLVLAILWMWTVKIVQLILMLHYKPSDYKMYYSEKERSLLSSL